MVELCQSIQNVLETSLTPERLEIIDESHKHRGHLGEGSKEGTHWKISIVSTKFVGKTRVQRHFMIYELLKDFIPHIHALSLCLSTPGEKVSREYFKFETGKRKQSL